MNQATLRGRLLKSLHRLANAGGCYDVLDVANESGLSLCATLRTVEQLHRAGFLERRTLRLTLAGLAAAVAIAARQRKVVPPLALLDPDSVAVSQLESCFGRIAAAIA